MRIKQVMVAVASLCLLPGAGVLLSTDVQAIYFNKVVIRSVDCGEVVTGISPADLANQNVTCAIRVKTIIRQCQNNGGNAGNASAFQFQSQPEVVQVVQGGSLTLTRQGKAFADIVLSDDAIAAAFPDLDNNGIADALDPALVCTNQGGNGVGGGTWTVAWKVFEFDVMGDLLTANVPGTLTGGLCQITSFNGLDSCATGITSTNCHITECIRMVPCLKDHFNIAVPDGTNCNCVESFKNGNSTTNCKDLDTNISQSP